MEPSSWPVHFRNAIRPSRNWYCASKPVPGSAGPLFCGLSRMNLGIRIRSAWTLLLCAALLCGVALAASPSDDASTKKSASHSTSSRSKKASVAPSPHSKSTSAKSSSAKTRTASSKRRKKKVRGQQKIDAERAQSIQEALIREHYLKGEASGKWDQASEEAMRRYQQDNGWQNKTVPDSRALIKLGLGPSKDHLLNPESAMTTVPDRPKADSIPTTSHSSPAVSNPPQTSAPGSTPVSSDTSRPQ
jgi:hypothetical protein